MNWLLQNTLLAAALAVPAWAICRFARPRPAVAHLLWLLVLVELALPPLWSWQVNLPASERIAEPASLAAPGPGTSVAVMPATPRTRPAVEPGGAMRSPPAPAARAASTREPRVRAVGGFGLPDLLPWLWVTGSTVFVLVAAVGCRRLAVRMGRGRPAPSHLTAMAREVGRRLGVAVPEILVLPDLASPCIWSLGRPRLLWPAGLTDAEPAKLRSLLAHELAHLRRRDHLVACFELTCAAVFWWHPLFWFARHQLRQQAELACDAWALWTEPADRFAYADALIGTLQNESRAERALPVLGARPGARHTFERRLKMILHQQVPRRPSRLTLTPFAALALALLPGLTFAQERTERRGESRQGLEQRIEREVREMVREILREELERGPERARPEREHGGIEIRIDGREVEVDRELRAALEEYLRDRDRDRRRDRERDRDRQEPERQGQIRIEGEIAGALREALEEARAEIANDPDLVEMGIAGDVQSILDGLLADGDPAAMSDALRNVMDKAIGFGLEEARAELEAEGLDPAFLDHLGGALRAGMRGDEREAEERAGMFGRALQGLIGQGIEMGLKEARAELKAEGFEDVRFLDDMADMLEATLSGREREAEDSARRLQESFQGFLGGALRRGLEEARAELKAEGLDPGLLDEIERSIHDELRRQGRRRDRGERRR